MTSLEADFGNHLFSEMPIIDGKCYPVHFVRSRYSSNKTLFVYNVEGARDTLMECWRTSNAIGGRGIFIHASWNLNTNHEYDWNGMINDVRICEECTERRPNRSLDTIGQFRRELIARYH